MYGSEWWCLRKEDKRKVCQAQMSRLSKQNRQDQEYKKREISPPERHSASECSIFKLICTFNCIISCSHEIFVMISQMVQVSECWQINTTRHPQTYTSKNKPSRYAVAVWVVIKKKRLKWFDHGSQVDGKQQITILRNAVHCIMDGWRKRQR